MQGFTKQTIHVFDFDGTITQKDSLWLLLQFCIPNYVKRWRVYFQLSPYFLMALFSTQKKERAKAMLLKKIWRGKTKPEIEAIGLQFFTTLLAKHLRPLAVKAIHDLVEKKEQVLLLSASCDGWLLPAARYFKTGLICTQLAYDGHQIFEGKLATSNCKGAEKVKRLLAAYPPTTYQFINYADSKSDLCLKPISTQFFYRYF